MLEQMQLASGFVPVNLAAGGSLSTKKLVVTSGFGGVLSAQFLPDAGTPNFLTVAPEKPGSPIFIVTPNTSALTAASTGFHGGRIRISEQSPDGHSVSTTDVNMPAPPRSPPSEATTDAGSRASPWYLLKVLL